MDVLFINPGNSSKIYQDLANDYSAIEPPTWSLLLAQSCRSVGYVVGLLDVNAEKLSNQEVLNRINNLNPRLLCFVVYGQNVNAGTVNMGGATELSKFLKENSVNIPIAFIGSHVQALPLKTLREEHSIDIVFSNEGVYALRNLLKEKNIDVNNLSGIKGIGYKFRKNNHEFCYSLNEPEKLVPQNLMDIDLPGYAWDLLPFKEKPFDLYRAPMWHAEYIEENRTPYAAIQTSLGCQFKCFDEKTIITTGFGQKSKKANEIKEGDKLLAFDEKNGKIVETEVQHIFRNKVNSLLKICFENGKILKVTEEHPFYVGKEWIEAKNLKVGDEIYHMTRFDKLNKDPKRRRKTSERMKEKNPRYDENISKKISKTFKKNYEEGKFSTKLNEENFHKNYPSYSKNIDLKKINMEKFSKRMSENNPMFDEDTRKKQNNTWKERVKLGKIIPYMCRQEYWDKLNVSKNKQEKIIEDILDLNFPNQWKFSGDGSFRIHYYSPDFINFDKKKIIEFNGCYWHKCKKCFPNLDEKIQDRRDKGNYKSRDQDRINFFEKEGYKVLEIWGHELKNEKELIKKIGHFMQNGIKIKSIEKIYGDFNVINFNCYPYDNYFAEMILSHNCDFCMINILNRNNNDPIGVAGNYSLMRYWSPDFIIKEFDKLVDYGVKTVKITDEMFLLNPKYYIPLCEKLIERGYGKKLSMWAYSRIDTIKRENILQLVRDAGIKWLALGIESSNRKVRLEVSKGKFEDVDIKQIIKQVQDSGIEVMANYIFGLPGENYESMENTLKLGLELCTIAWNGYPAMALPGSKLYKDALEKNYELPDDYIGFSFHSYNTQPLRNEYLTSSEILKFRDEAFVKYHSYLPFLEKIEKRYGKKAIDNIQKMLQIKLKRKILGE